MIRYIEHIAVAVTDADASVRWYRNLGFHVTHDELRPELGVRLLYLVPSGIESDREVTTIQLVEPLGHGPIADFIREQGEGLHHVCFAVDDLVAASELVGEPAPDITRGGRDRRACFLQARPNDARIELTETLPFHQFVAPAPQRDGA